MNGRWPERVWRNGREAAKRILQRIIAVVRLVWDWLGRLFRRRPAEPGPALQPVVAEDALPPVQDRPPPILQELFAFSVTESKVAIDPRLWDAVILARPRLYRIPDPDFTRVLAIQSVVRSLRWAAQVPDDLPASVTIHPDAWKPPYKALLLADWATGGTADASRASEPPAEAAASGAARRGGGGSRGRSRRS